MSSPAVAAGLTPSEQAERVAAVILNKVDNLRWFYFGVDLDKKTFQLDLKEQRPDLRVLARIEDSHVGDRSCRYKWVGNDKEKKDLLPCLLFVLRTNPETGRQLFRRIFDLNEVPASEADKGLLGFANRLTREQRLTSYRRNVMKGECPITLVAEGDSWFQYPFPSIGVGPLRWDIVKDIVDHFMQDGRYRVRSLATGGIWLSTMLQAGEYVTELSRINPDFFLFSGGGDDLTTDGRVAFMVHQPSDLDPSIKVLICKRDHFHHPTFDPVKYEAGLRCLSWEFFSLLNLVFLQYLLLLQSLSHPKLAHLGVITHGYDFLIPRRRNPHWFKHGPVQWIENKLVAGRWLWVPMQEKKLDDASKQAAAYTIIYEFNELLISLAEHSGHPNLFHIDCRSLAAEEDWYDELHLTSKAFGRVTRLFQKCIETAKPADVCRTGNKKVFDLKDLA